MTCPHCAVHFHHNWSDKTFQRNFKLRTTVDGIRNLSIFSAHPIDDKTTLHVIDVEPHEAEWCLEIIEEMFEHLYVGPAMTAWGRVKPISTSAPLFFAPSTYS
jgi:hypothetical protein